MKNFRLQIGLLSLMALASCAESGELDTPATDDTTPKAQMTISATTDNGGSSADTSSAVTDMRSSLVVESGVGKVYWTSGDRISLMSDKEVEAVGFTSTLEEGDTALTSDFEGDEFSNDGGIYYALYPHDASKKANYTEKTMTMELPATQVYVEGTAAGSFVSGASPAIAYSENLNDGLSFKNVCGLLQVGITGVGDLSYISVTASSGRSLWGDITVDMSSMPDSFSTTISGGGDTVTLDFSSAPVTLSEETQYFTIALPPTGTGTEELVITAGSAESDKLTSTITIEKSIERSELLKITSQTLSIDYLELSDFDSAGKVDNEYLSTSEPWLVKVEDTATADDYDGLTAALTNATGDVDLVLMGSTLPAEALTDAKSATYGFSIDLSNFDVIPNSFLLRSGVSSVTFSSDVTKIADYAFNNCRYLTTIIGLENVPAAGETLEICLGAFATCTIIEEVNMSRATKLGTNAFMNTWALETIVLGSVTEMGDDVFYTSNSTSLSLTSLTLSAAGNITATSPFNTNFDTTACALTINEDKISGTATPAADIATGEWFDKTWKSINDTIPSGSVGDTETLDFDLSDFDGMTSESIPATTSTWVIDVTDATGAGDYAGLLAVLDETSDVKLKFTTSSENPTLYALSTNTGTTSITTTYETSIASLDITGFTEIPDNFLSGYADLKSVTLDPNTTSIGVSAFNFCDALTEIKGLDGNRTETNGLILKNFALANCTSLASMDLTPVTELWQRALAKTALTTINLPNATSFGNQCIATATTQTEGLKLILSAAGVLSENTEGVSATITIANMFWGLTAGNWDLTLNKDKESGFSGTAGSPVAVDKTWNGQTWKSISYVE